MYLVEMIEVLATLLLLRAFGVGKLFYLYFWLTVIVVCPSYWLLPRGGYGPLLLWSIAPDFIYVISYLAIIRYLCCNSPVEVRTSVITVFTNVSSLTGTVFPLVISFLLKTTGDPYVAPKIGWLISIISFICIFVFLRHINKVPASTNDFSPKVSANAG